MKKRFTTKTIYVVMKKIYCNSILILFALLPLSIFAQNNACGTSIEDMRALGKQLLENRGKEYLHTRGAVVYVPVCFHLVARTDGTGRVQEGKVLDMLAGWNQLYADNNLDMQFYIKYFDYMNTDEVFSSSSSSLPSNIKMDDAKKLDAVNIYLIDKIVDPSGNPGTTLAYYSRNFDWIVCINSEVSKSKSATIAHEAGHFFTLLHPFHGWECDPFHPTATAACANGFVSCNGTVYTVENVARTGVDANCASSGDFMCDTPADYNFGFTRDLDWRNPTNPCVYNGIGKDPKCVAVDPDESLVMGYFIGCTDPGKGKFTGEQKAAILKDYGLNSRRASIRSSFVPNTIDISVSTLQLPTNGSTTASYNAIFFDWVDVPNATGYILEISTSQTNFDIGRRFFINSATSQIQINTSNIGAYLIANKAYYWRVRAFGSYKTMTDFTGNFSFTTGTTNAVNEIPGIEGFSIAPNPVGESRQINISLTSEKAFKANIKIQNLAGQIMLRDVRNFESGSTNQIIDVKNLSQGVYILSIENESGVLNKKIVVGH
jgi:Secretion system C-terminal sorting domain